MSGSLLRRMGSGVKTRGVGSVWSESRRLVRQPPLGARARLSAALAAAEVLAASHPPPALHQKVFSNLGLRHLSHRSARCLQTLDPPFQRAAAAACNSQPQCLQVHFPPQRPASTRQPTARTRNPATSRCRLQCPLTCAKERSRWLRPFPQTQCRLQ